MPKGLTLHFINNRYTLRLGIAGNGVMSIQYNL